MNRGAFEAALRQQVAPIEIGQLDVISIRDNGTWMRFRFGDKRGWRYYSAKIEQLDEALLASTVKLLKEAGE
jgi:hypothetical protein